LAYVDCKDGFHLSLIVSVSAGEVSVCVQAYGRAGASVGQADVLVCIILGVMSALQNLINILGKVQLSFWFNYNSKSSD
jgi:hypothetical protein